MKGTSMQPVLPSSLQTALLEHGTLDWTNSVIDIVIKLHQSFMSGHSEVKMQPSELAKMPGMSEKRQAERVAHHAERNKLFGEAKVLFNDTLEENHLNRLKVFIGQSIPGLSPHIVESVVTWVVTRA